MSGIDDLFRMPMDVRHAVEQRRELARDERMSYAEGLITSEAGELLQIIGNARRFGLDTPEHGMSTSAIRSFEAGDVIAAIEWACEAGYLDMVAVFEQRDQKSRKLRDPLAKDSLGRRLAPPLPGRP